MAHMRIGVYSFFPGKVEQVTGRAIASLAPRLRQTPGFISYEIVHTGPESVVSLTTWETAAQADAAAGMLAEWVKSEVPDALRSVVNHIGEVRFSTLGR